MDILGKLTLQSIPYDNPILMFAGAIMIGTAIAVLAGVTYFGKWKYLYTEWLTTVDHKKIGVMYLIIAFIFLLRGFIDALMMRAQQAFASGGSEGYLPPHHFAELFTGHGTMMIFFMGMPFLIGLMNIAVPTQIGARDVAFPYLNAVSLWLTASAGMLVMASLIIGSFSDAGWTGYAPYSGISANPGVGVDYWIWALQISGIGTTITGINFFVTIMRERAPGMKFMRMPLFTWTTLCTNILMVLAFPALTVVLALLTFDRYLGMHFFTSDGGGNQMMFINMFWVWGHPEVYILILPAFGVFSEVAATFSNKRLFGYVSMVGATMVIALLSFTVWVHHFFTMAQDPLRNSIFAIATMVIGVPTGVKIYDWIFTMYRGRVRFNLPMLWLIGFIITFTIGGMTGVMLAIPGIDFKMHNSEFLVAHFHNVLIPGMLFGLFAGYHYWFPKAFGFRLDEKWGRRSFWGWLIGFYVAFMPLYVLGLMGMPRRMVSYADPAWQPFLIVAAFGALIVLFGVVSMAIQLIVSVRNREQLRDITGDPWNGRTLDWATSSPPAHYNFAVIPTVEDIDAFTDMKERGVAYRRPDKYEDIEMPRSTPAALVIGALSFFLGFALIWHIWWLAAVTGVGIIVTVIVRGCNDNTWYTIPAEEVERTENEWFRQLEKAGVV
ncbi:MAG: cytochrome o ubiquinol oxidase subunit I [Salinisphaera sp.]|jgi:cytochrome o ubiquinol oxidase subunit 1|nr:cytochrome o ubiquinol oxidase subunit I [Salinisphaera sp.]